MTERRPVLRAGLMALAVLGATLLAGCSSSPDRSAPTLAQVRELLARHGTAVLHRDRSAFAADLDPAEQAAGFRVRQQQMFANLARVPLGGWSYHLEGRTDSSGAEAAAGRKFDTGALIARVSLQYALRGVDPIPTQHDLWLTFVRHDGRVVLAADDSLAQAGGRSWQGPWDFGPLAVRRGAHSLVLFHPSAAGTADVASTAAAVEAIVDAAVPAVSAVWGQDWTQDVAVLVPASQPELLAEAGESADAALTVAAVAVSDGQDPVTGGVYGQRLIVNSDALAQLSDIGRQIVIRHEVTHIASAAATSAASPTWLIEGFADYVGNLGSGQSAATVAAELTADVRHGRVPAALPTPDRFSTPGQSAQAYEGSWLACRLIAERAGQDGLVRFYKIVGASPESSDDAVATGLRKVLHESTAEFVAQWRDYLTAQLGR
ncbi:MAG: hypothetical protein QOH89_1271 [Pseudonocardiales bacterium]|nr:hypothetical protein [Pseudonocardiales bacterium]